MNMITKIFCLFFLFSCSSTKILTTVVSKNGVLNNQQDRVIEINIQKGNGKDLIASEIINMLKRNNINVAVTDSVIESIKERLADSTNPKERSDKISTMNTNFNIEYINYECESGSNCKRALGVLDLLVKDKVTKKVIYSDIIISDNNIGSMLEGTTLEPENLLTNKVLREIVSNLEAKLFGESVQISLPFITPKDSLELMNAFNMAKQNRIEDSILILNNVAQGQNNSDFAQAARINTASLLIIQNKRKEAGELLRKIPYNLYPSEYELIRKSL